MPATSHLTHLEAAGLVQLAALRPEVEYAFRHVLVKEAAYFSLVKGDRRLLHHVVGETLEHLYLSDGAGGHEGAELNALLGHHFAEAGDEPRALKYYSLAGDVAAQVYANVEAIMHYERALELGRRLNADPAQIVGLATRLGRVMELDGQYDEALRVYLDLEALAHERGDRSMELASLLQRATIHVVPSARFDLAQAETLAEQALQLAGELGDLAAEARIYWILLHVNTWFGEKGERDLARAVASGERSLALARKLGLREQLAYTLTDLSRVYLFAGGAEQDLAALAEARDLWRELGNRPMLAESLSNMGAHYMLSGEAERAIGFLEEAYEISRSAGNAWGQANSLMMQSIILLNRGQPGRAIQLLEECLRLGESGGFLYPTVVGRAMLGLVYGSLGDLDRGFELGRQALAFAEERLPTERVAVVAMLAVLHLRAGDHAEAERLIAECTSAGELTAARDFSAVLLAQARAELALARRDYGRAIEVADAIIQIPKLFGMQVFKLDLRRLRGEALLAQGRDEEAWAELQAASAEAQDEMAGTPPLWKILVLMSQIEARRGHPEQASELRHGAREQAQLIADRTGSPELRASFLNLPDVRELFDEKEAA